MTWRPIPDGFVLLHQVSGLANIEGQLRARLCARCRRSIEKQGGFLIRNERTGAEFVVGSNCVHRFKEEAEQLAVWDALAGCTACGGKQWPSHREGDSTAFCSVKYATRDRAQYEHIRSYLTTSFSEVR